jgi:hypothetical protein
MNYSKVAIRKKDTSFTENFAGQQARNAMPAVHVLQKASPEEEELPVQGKWVAQRQTPEEELPMQGKFTTIQRTGDVAINDHPGLENEADVMGAKALQTKPDDGTLQRKEGSSYPNNTGLPDNLKTGVETLSGISMDNVNVHYNSPHPAQLQALAYAQGTDIHIAPGQEHHLPHEAWHVVQQMQGRVQPTRQIKEEQ